MIGFAAPVKPCRIARYDLTMMAASRASAEAVLVGRGDEIALVPA